MLSITEVINGGAALLFENKMSATMIVLYGIVN